MASIINGLFAGRSGIASHGLAIAVVGDDIANSSTIGYKESRSDFSDLLAGGQARGRAVGSGSQISAITQIFSQGTLEFTGRSLDLAIDGNGFFAIADGAERFYSRAGNLKVDPSGFLVTQGDLAILGYASGGSGTLEPLNINSISQDSVATSEIFISGNVAASATVLASGTASIPTVSEAGVTTSTTTYADLNAVAAFSTFVPIFDTLGQSHTITYFFFKTNANEYTVRGYVNSEEVDPGASPTSGLPRLITDGTTGDITMTFNGDGTRSNTPATGTSDLTYAISWNNNSDPSSIDASFTPFTQFSNNSNILSLTQDGKGVGNVTSLSIEKNGDIFAILDNGQTSNIGSIKLVNFSNPEGLTRVGGQLLQQSPGSGEPIVGDADTGTFGIIQAGAVELSTVDIANQFVKLITLQRGFQANSRIITTINQLLNEIIQLA